MSSAMLFVSLALAPVAFGQQPATDSIAEWQAAIQRWDKVDRDHPEYLDASLNLARASAVAAARQCDRLATAEKYRKAVESSGTAQVFIGRYGADLAAAGYEIEMARMACSASDGKRAEARRAAIKFADSARRSYGGKRDFASAATFSYLQAKLYAELGEMEDARRHMNDATSYAAMAGDVERTGAYYRQLRTWVGEPPGDEEVARYSAKANRRISSPMKFHLYDFNADGYLNYWRRSFEGGALRKSAFTLAHTGTVTRTESQVVYDLKLGGPEPDYSSAEGVSDLEQKLEVLMVQATHGVPQAEIDAQGRVEDVAALELFTGNMRKQLDTLLEEHRVAGDQNVTALKVSVIDGLSKLLHPSVAEARTREMLQLQGLQWNGMTMKQGSWNTVTMNLGAAGMPWESIEHEVRITVTGVSACSQYDRAACLELMLVASPLPAGITKVQEAAERAGRGRIDYIAEKRLYLKIDPATLEPYSVTSEEDSYMGGNANGKRWVKVRGEQVVKGR
jgi:hypothetical protein